MTSFNGLSFLAATAGVPLDFTFAAADPGADDLTFTWTWGDGTADSRTEPASGSNPANAVDQASHVFTAVGVYTVQLTLTDDDGGLTWLIGGLALDQMVDIDSDGAPDMGLEEAIIHIEGVLLSPDAADADYEQVKSMADSINNMGH